MKEKIIAVFEIGNFNGKLLLYNHDLIQVAEFEEKLLITRDEDGLECVDIELIEKWVKKSVLMLIHSSEWDLAAFNFTSYDPALIFLDSHGKRLTPLYNQSKPIDKCIPEQLYNRYGGMDEFCLQTASPAIGMKNSGIQIFWLKNAKPEVFARTKYILHLPQYLSYLFSESIFSEYTSTGYHSALWDFDNMKYHKWVKAESIPLPDFVHSGKTFEVNIEGKKIIVGVGINDIVACLQPFFSVTDKEFILASTGNDCVTLNPFNRERLTAEQLANDCLCFLSNDMQPFKSSMFSMGQLHDAVLQKMSRYFKIQGDSFKLIKPDMKLFNKLSTMFRGGRIFFNEGEYTREIKDEPDLFEFDHFVEAYHQLMIELSDITVEAINLVIPKHDNLENLFLTGRFSKNDLFIKLIASSYPHLKVFTTDHPNISALGAALSIYGSVFNEDKPILDIGLTECLIGRG